MTNPRLIANREIIRLLSEYLERWPDQRFTQALLNLGILKHQILELKPARPDPDSGLYIPPETLGVFTDTYYEEPSVILRRVEAAVRRREE